MIALYLAIGVLDAIALAVLIAVPGRWAWRAAAILVALLVNLALLGAVPDTSGQAAHREPPDQQQLLSCFVEEPVAIYLWMLVDDRPTAYRVEYSRDLHGVCAAANRAIAQGTPVGLAAARGEREGGERLRGRYVPYVLPPPGHSKQGGGG